MRNFQWNRFWQLLRLPFVENARRIVIGCGVLYGVTLLVITSGVFGVGSIFLTIPSSEMPFDPVLLTVITGLSNANELSSLALMVILSRVLINMGRRSGEMHYLLLPASNLEKWLARVVYIIVVGVLLVYLISYAAIFTWGGVATLLGLDCAPVFVDCMWNSSALLTQLHIETTWAVFFASYAANVMIIAFFIWGGSRFRHYAWLYSMLIFFGVIFVSSFGLGLFVGVRAAMTGQVPDFHNGTLSLASWNDVFLVMGGLSILLTLLFFWLSYRLFCRRQLESV